MLLLFYGNYTLIASGASFLVCSIARAVYITSTKKHFKMNKEIGMIMPKKKS